MSDLPEGKPILCVDFDGVLHSYSSGWKGARVIPDPPVEGAIQFLIKANEYFQVCIYSSRSRYIGGRRAMKKWLRKHYINLFKDEIDYSAGRFINSLKFPLMKPAAFLQIDDRAITFDGKFPFPPSLLAFKPWNKKEVAL